MYADPYIGMIAMFAGNFAPVNHMRCDGQLLPISQYTALFALIGTTYGGDGQNTFALPDFRGRRPLHRGQGPGLSNYQIGQVSGTENITLLSSNLPQHNHSVVSLTGAPPANASGGQASPASAVFGGLNTQYNADPTDKVLATSANSTTTTVSGSNSPINIVKPYLAITMLIAVEGIFPSRN